MAEIITWNTPRNYDSSYTLVMATDNFIIYRGQTSPEVRGYIQKKENAFGDNVNQNLNEIYTAYFSLFDSKGILVFRKPAAMLPLDQVTQQKGVVEYQWDPEDTLKIGHYTGVFDFKPLDSESTLKKFSLPKNGPFRITIK